MVGSILIIDDDDDILTAGRILLHRRFSAVITCRKPDRVPDLLAQHDFDVVLLDMNFGPGESSGEQGLGWLRKILEIDPQVVVIMVTAHGSVNTAVDAMKLGATDFISKPWQNEKVIATVSAGVELHRSRVEAESLRQSNKALTEVAAPAQEIVGDSARMQEVLSIIDRAAPTDANVLILGENGTGKELIAQELHRRSARSDRVFLPVDMGSITDTLFESEMFGHRKGSFTGADEDRIGRFQAANGGTLFHVRVVAATNATPNKLRNPQNFRQDLLYRLNTVEVTVPPLRDRREDILPIARHYAAIYARKYNKPEKKFSEAAEKVLHHYDWPGNVRSLRHSVERATILAKSDTFDPADLQLAESTPTDSTSSTLNLDEMEKEVVSKALRKYGFNISRAAKELGLTRTSLYRRMEKYDL